VTKKWDDPQLDAAQFAIDRFLNAQQNVSEQMSEIYQSIRNGSATDEDRKTLKSLREQYIALSKEVARTTPTSLFVARGKGGRPVECRRSGVLHLTRRRQLGSTLCGTAILGRWRRGLHLNTRSESRSSVGTIIGTRSMAYSR